MARDDRRLPADRAASTHVDAPRSHGIRYGLAERSHTGISLVLVKRFSLYGYSMLYALRVATSYLAVLTASDYLAVLTASDCSNDGLRTVYRELSVTACAHHGLQPTVELLRRAVSQESPLALDENGERSAHTCSAISNCSHRESTMILARETQLFTKHTRSKQGHMRYLISHLTFINSHFPQATRLYNSMLVLDLLPAIPGLTLLIMTLPARPLWSRNLPRSFDLPPRSGPRWALLPLPVPAVLSLTAGWIAIIGVGSVLTQVALAIAVTLIPASLLLLQVWTVLDGVRRTAACTLVVALPATAAVVAALTCSSAATIVVASVLVLASVAGAIFCWRRERWQTWQTWLESVDRKLRKDMVDPQIGLWHLLRRRCHQLLSSSADTDAQTRTSPNDPIRRPRQNGASVRGGTARFATCHTRSSNPRRRTRGDTRTRPRRRAVPRLRLRLRGNTAEHRPRLMPSTAFWRVTVLIRTCPSRADLRV